MRIGLFIDTMNLGGAESIVMALAGYIKRAGHVPIIYHFGNAELARYCDQQGIGQIRPRGHYWYKKTYRLPFFAWLFSRMLKADRIDVLHSHLFGPIVAGALACRLAGAAHLGTLHDVYIVEERPIRARLLRAASFLGTRLVCVSEEMAEFYADIARIPISRLNVIRNGVDLGRYRVAPQSSRPHSPPRLIMVGRLDRIKRHDLLFDALKKLPAEIDWRADIVGDGPERLALQSQCQRLGLDGRVVFHGQCGDVPARLAAADVFALVSDSEGMSLSLIEALASGLPVIATRVGNNAEFVNDGRNGYLIEPGDCDALQWALEQLFTDPAMRLRFGANSSQLANEQLDEERAFRAYIAAYLDAV